ncbi:MAG: glutamate--cysteine ligase [Pseudonocardiales bacterium]|nr:glutamate--cysteine ligase [Pseudonocardiales bacterium]
MGQGRSVGVEEELLLVDPDSGRALAVSGAALEFHNGAGEDGDADEGASLGAELTLQQLETGTHPCTSLDELAAEIRRWRQTAAAAARAAGAEVAALATSPLPVEPSITPKPRYRRMADEFGPTAQEQLTCGCHVHVQVDSDEEAVAVLDRIRGWLPTLLALSANSPFWQGTDTGYASFRSQVWTRWPSAGTPATFGSAEEYQRTVQAMIDTGGMLDEGMVYFDARVSRKYPTVEIRVPDMCLLAEDTLLLAALGRALVDTAAAQWRAGDPPDATRIELLRLAAWRAGRSGLETDLVDPAGRPAPAGQVADALLDHVRPALERTGELARVEHLLATVLERGNGAQAQRKVYANSGRLDDVVRYATEQTLAD